MTDHARLPSIEDQLAHLRAPGAPTAVNAWVVKDSQISHQPTWAILMAWSENEFGRHSQEAVVEARRALRERAFWEWYGELGGDEAWSDDVFYDEPFELPFSNPSSGCVQIFGNRFSARILFAEGHDNDLPFEFGQTLNQAARAAYDVLFPDGAE